jgi:hypothetical protein
MDTNKKSYKSNNLPIVIALILIPVLFIFGTMLIVGIVMTANRPNIKLTASEASNITSSQATFSLSIEGDSNKINEKGFVYGTTTNPEIQTRSGSTNPVFELFNGYDYGSYKTIGNYVKLDKNSNTTAINDLSSETNYYVRAYAMTDYGTIYSNEISFSTEKKIEPNSINKNTAPKNTTDGFQNIIINTPSDYNPNDPDSRNKKRLGDINSILTAVLQLKRIDPNAEIFKKNDAYTRNIRLSGSGRCIYSSVSLEDSTLQASLKKFGYSIPEDPVAKTEGCSDYTIKIWDYRRDGELRNIIEIEAYNVDKGEIIRVDSTGSE